MNSTNGFSEFVRDVKTRVRDWFSEKLQRHAAWKFSRKLDANTLGTFRVFFETNKRSGFMTLGADVGCRHEPVARLMEQAWREEILGVRWKPYDAPVNSPTPGTLLDIEAAGTVLEAEVAKFCKSAESTWEIAWRERSTIDFVAEDIVRREGKFWLASPEKVYPPYLIVQGDVSTAVTTCKSMVLSLRSAERELEQGLLARGRTLTERQSDWYIDYYDRLLRASGWAGPSVAEEVES